MQRQEQAFRNTDLVPAVAGWLYGTREPTGADTLNACHPEGTLELLHSEQLDLKDQGSVWWYDAARASRAVAELWWDYQLALAADLHRHHSLVPPLDDLPDADLKSEGLPTINRAVKLCSVLKRARVVNRDHLTLGRAFAVANDDVVMLQT